MSKRFPPHAMAQVATFAFSGIDAIPVEVQVQLSSGAPNFLIVGLADKQTEVEEFFTQHKIRLGGKLIDQHLERLAVAVEFRKREGSKLEASLAI